MCATHYISEFKSSLELHCCVINTSELYLFCCHFILVSIVTGRHSQKAIDYIPQEVSVYSNFVNSDFTSSQSPPCKH